MPAGIQVEFYKPHATEPFLVQLWPVAPRPGEIIRLYERQEAPTQEGATYRFRVLDVSYDVFAAEGDDGDHEPEPVDVSVAVTVEAIALSGAAQPGAATPSSDESRAAMRKALAFFENDTPLAREAGLATLRSALGVAAGPTAARDDESLPPVEEWTDAELLATLAEIERQDDAAHGTGSPERADG